MYTYIYTTRTKYEKRNNKFQKGFTKKTTFYHAIIAHIETNKDTKLDKNDFLFHRYYYYIIIVVLYHKNVQEDDYGVFYFSKDRDDDDEYFKIFG